MIACKDEVEIEGCWVECGQPAVAITMAASNGDRLDRELCPTHLETNASVMAEDARTLLAPGERRGRGEPILPARSGQARPARAR